MTLFDRGGEKGDIGHLKSVTLRRGGGGGGGVGGLGLSSSAQAIGQLHDDVILLQLPESLSVLFSCAN